MTPRAFAEQLDKKGQKEGEVGIEGTTIQAADTVSARKQKIHSRFQWIPESSSSCTEIGIEGIAIQAANCEHAKRRLHPFVRRDADVILTAAAATLVDI